MLRTRIQATALEEFRARGYAGASIDGIARAAGVSRTTIYALYTDKQTLFGEMIRAGVRGMDLARHVAFDDRPPVVILREAMLVLNRAYYRVPNIEVIRLCIAEADRFPEMMERVLDLLGRSLTDLAAYFARLRDDRRLVVDECENAARIFNMLALGSLRPFFVHQDRMSEDEMAGHIDLALQIFMRGCLTGPDAATATVAKA